MDRGFGLMLLSSDTGNSGIYVVEGPAQGQPIPVDGESITAFIGPTPRGPVDHAVPVESLTEFQKIFGAPECHCRMEFAIQQFFANGGTKVAVVRVSGTSKRNRIHIPGPSGELTLEARNPGPLEHLRASVDYDGVEDAGEEFFNLVIQRLRSPGSVWIDAQEYYRNVSVDPANRDYIGYVLGQSELVGAIGATPQIRPAATYKQGSIREAGYIETLAECVDSPAPTDYDLIGSAALGTGLNALEQVPDIGQICLISGAESAPLGPVALLAADRFCRSHQAQLIIDPPERWHEANDVLGDQERSGFASPNAVTWFPGVFLKSSHGEEIQTTIVGAVAASLVASDRMTGVQQLHADGPLMLRSGTKLCATVQKGDVYRLSRAGINALVQRSALHYQLLGNITQARYGSIAAQWNELDLRRQALFILRRIRSGTRWSFFQSSEHETWQSLRDQVVDFLTELHSRSILAGETAESAFFVKCDADTNAGNENKTGELSFVVGFALRRPGDYLAFRFQRSAGVCKITELGWQSGIARAG
ncbi:MAG: hypothetical protein QF790_10110 [Gammaproteobacteria bacterium]|jgi:hypothetical protein|nr:hypothetical protein [Gammaproteobacteria bacterium]MDP6617505.1 hypothetical protein [Gammaproteobacteria bacterium]MDP6695934.1 hypothetical protein [Gammaproteobacteria bacterium]